MLERGGVLRVCRGCPGTESAEGEGGGDEGFGVDGVGEDGDGGFEP